nr:MAG TPA: hypothetical protein [Microviridae sp.]
MVVNRSRVLDLFSFPRFAGENLFQIIPKFAM